MLKKYKKFIFEKNEPSVYLRDDEMIHPCVGAIIIRNDEILMIERQKFPFGWACVAGHIDEGEEPVISLIREVKEESGLDVISHELLFEEEINNPCRRGVNYHYWYVYKCDVTGDFIENKDEVKNIKWENIDNLKKLNLEPVWKYIFEKLDMI